MQLARLPVPQLFMGLSVGIFALLTLSAFSSVDARAVAPSVAFPVLLAATVRAGTTSRHGHGRPLLGLGAGLLTGAAGASSLVGLGLAHPAGPQWIYLPLVFATLGTMLGLSAGVQRPRGGVADPGHLHAPAARSDLEMTS